MAKLLGRSSDGQGRQNWEAYSIGASFIYFLDDVYGAGSARRLMGMLGRTGNFDAATLRAVELDEDQIEAAWIAYLSKVDKD